MGVVVDPGEVQWLRNGTQKDPVNNHRVDAGADNWTNGLGRIALAG